MCVFRGHTLAHGLCSLYDQSEVNGERVMRILCAVLLMMLGGCATRNDAVLKPHQVEVQRYAQGSAKYAQDFASN